MNKYSVCGFVVYVAVDDLPAVHFATALNEADAAAIAEAMNERAAQPAVGHRFSEKKERELSALDDAIEAQRRSMGGT